MAVVSVNAQGKVVAKKGSKPAGDTKPAGNTKPAGEDKK